MSAIIICLLITLFAIILKILHCEFPLGIYIIGTIITAESIGTVGFATTLFSNNLILGYILSVSYYLMCWTGIINEEAPLYLFSMVNIQAQQKGTLILIIVFNIVGSGIWLHSKK